MLPSHPQVPSFIEEMLPVDAKRKTQEISFDRQYSGPRTPRSDIFETLFLPFRVHVHADLTTGLVPKVMNESH